jgi:DNA-binding winged helix-turn-helix (wHTH) protein/energy-coupling factor transporter ATP-binding protein EcfA2
MSLESLPYAPLIRSVLGDLVAGQCVSITGLSNSGKSSLMRLLASSPVEQTLAEESGQPRRMVLVDCNRAVAITAQAFYEVVLRALLERVEDLPPAGLDSSLRSHHLAVTEAPNPFSASLAFNNALCNVFEESGLSLVLLLDEFDELYATLDERALLNLRALHDRFMDRLALVVATVRQLPEVRAERIEDEFAELFARSTHAMPMLTEVEAQAMLEQNGLGGLSKAEGRQCFELSGGHPGLLAALAQAVAGPSQQSLKQPVTIIGQRPQIRAECLKIWSQITEEEQAGLISLVLESEAGLPQPQLKRLAALGLVQDRTVFSPLFADFVARRARSPEVSSQGVHLDRDSGDVWVDGMRIPVLTDLEFRLLELLYERLDKLTDKYRIVTAVWGEEYLGDVDDARVEKLVSRLRSKIEADPGRPRYLITLRGRGYRLLSQPAAQP